MAGTSDKLESMAEKLRREVEPPQRQHTGLGVMLIASAAMFFAVAGSAFILRARMANAGCPYSHGLRHHTNTLQAQPAPIPNPPSDCGRAVYHTGRDGTMSVTYELCPAQEADPVDANTAPAVYPIDVEPGVR